MSRLYRGLGFACRKNFWENRLGGTPGKIPSKSLLWSGLFLRILAKDFRGDFGEIFLFLPCLKRLISTGLRDPDLCRNLR